MPAKRQRVDDGEPAARGEPDHASAEAEQEPSRQAEQQWHVDYRRPLSTWASVPLPPCAERLCADTDNFVKGVRWSPDGTMLLSNSEDHALRLWALQRAALPDAWTSAAPAAAADADSVLQLSRTYPEAECIYDFCWYPGARSADPSTCCALSCSRDTPLHLWDAAPAAEGGGGKGKVRASYLPCALRCCLALL